MIDSRHLRKNVGEHLVRISLDSEVLNESSEFNLISGQIGTRCLNLLQSHVTAGGDAIKYLVKEEQDG